MRAIALVVALAFALALAPLAADAQQTAKVPRIGFLYGGSAGAGAEAFQQKLRDLGYVEGQNVALEWRVADGRYDRLPDLAVQLVRLQVDIIVAPGIAAATAAKSTTSTIPIVMIGAADPVEGGLVASLAHPGGNITGSSFQVGPEMMGKLLELLKEAVPNVSRVAVLWNPADAAHTSFLRAAEAAARPLRIRLQPLAARNPGEFDAAFSAMSRQRAGALFVMPDGMFLFHRNRIADLAAKSRLPAVYGTRQYAEAGGLMSYGVDVVDRYRRAAIYVDKILKGAKPADLPVEQPTKFELVINMKTAKALGLTIPQSVLLRADEVIR